MTPDKPSAEAVRHELERVLSSPGFARNARMSRFLRFIVEGHLEGRDDELKESLIAYEVFGRKPDYDPKLDSIVRTEAARLRSRLLACYVEAGRGAAVIIEVPRGGYVPVFRRPEPAPPGPIRERDAEPRRLVITLGAAIIITAAVVGSALLRGERAPIPIAVLPLASLSHEPSGDDFADGLTDEIIRNLSMIEGLDVRSRTSSFLFKGRPRDVRDTGRRLQADYLLDGSVLRAGGHLRIDVQLIRVRDDAPLWSGRFDRGMTDIFGIQDEISLAIVNSLRLRLGQGRRRYETSVAAYDEYLAARALSLGHEAADYPSIAGFERAIGKDPAFAPAYAGLATSYAVRSIQFPLAHPSDELTRMRTAAEKAIELDPLLAEAYAALAMADARDGRWETAERGFRRAIQLDANRSRTRSDFGMWFLDVIGRHDEAIAQLRRALSSDPLSQDAQLKLAWVLMSAGRYDEAVEHCASIPADNLLRIQCLGRARLGQGRSAEAIALFNADPWLPRNPQTRGFLGYALARSGRREDAERMAASSSFANEQALIYAGLGDKGRTLNALERMASLGAQRVGGYLNGPEMAFLRGDPQATELRRKIGLPN